MFQQWLAQTPESVPYSPLYHRLASWIATAHSFVTGDEENLRQQVIERLGTEGGFSRVKEILDAAPRGEVVDQTELNNWYTNMAVPFMKTIAHHNVAQSLLLERPLDSIHILLHGTGGARGAEFFEAVALASVQVSEHEGLLDNLNATLTVLRRIIEVNGSAKANDRFLHPVRNFEEWLSKQNPTQAKVANCQRLLHRLLKTMGQGLSIPEAQNAPSRTLDTMATFELGADLPGGLREGGPRHDNDHDDISQIEILPTRNEVESQYAEYLPINNPRRLHLPAVEGLIDRHFRLVREDTVGQLRDAVRHQIQQLRRSSGSASQSVSQHKGSHVIIYHDLRFEKIIPGRDYLSLQVSFQQPPNLATKSRNDRKAWWESSRSLQKDALVCVINASGFVSFLSVCEDVRKKTGHHHQTYDSGYFDNAHKATAFLRLIEPYEFSFNSAAACLKVQEKHASRTLVLCEFPGVLLPAFWYTLDALKLIIKKAELPFTELISPQSTNEPAATLNQPPEYMLGRGFYFDLSSLIDNKDTLHLTAERRFDYELLQKHSTLDAAQQMALITGLTSRLALIQGPPGTGKSFVGVAMTKVLLENKVKAHLGPVICVCYTNHALDQLLEHLVKADIKQIIRIGGQSKSEVLQDVNLSKVAKQAADTPTERRRRWELHKQREGLSDSVKNDLATFEDVNAPYVIYQHVQNTNPDHFDDLDKMARTEVDEEGFQLIDYDNRPPLEKWLHPRRADRLNQAWRDASQPRSLNDLQSISLLAMSIPERQALYTFWQEQIRAEKASALSSSFNQIRKVQQSLRNCFRERDLRCLRQANVIGLTTSGLAKNLDLLRRVGSKVLLCEEAGEVLEAHMLTAFLPSIEHAILIGDHQQLRPQIQNYELQSTNPRGRQYSLDVSLFERLIDPPFTFMPKLQYSTLEVQRRMDPSISDLIRQTLYPRLQDHESVLQQPKVAGMCKRLFWVDHRNAEQKRDHTSSRANVFEVDMVAALVSHLVRQCRYGADEIAVLTPYLGQLRKLKRKMASMFEILIDDRDEVQLQQAGLQHDEDTAATGMAVRSTLLKALRLATVDNFQGEEAKVVIISLVRSNDEKNCGFLRTDNRANVLLSRAQHGMYLIGDSSCYEPQPMWAKVIELLRNEGNIADHLPLQCPRHPETAIQVKSADDFLRYSPEGGCDLKCADRLECGHSCPNRCHAQTLHENVWCPEPCLKPRAGCVHLCDNACGDQCGKCNVPVEDVLLPCGHTSTAEPCYIFQDPRLARCNHIVQRDMPGCLHRVDMKCFEIIEDSTPCMTRCGDLLSCHHNCSKHCYQCRKRENGSIINVDHGSCGQVCGAKYNTCGHACTETCHRSRSECGPCKAKCQTRCRHSACAKACNEPCAPCAEPCGAGCEHSETCNLPCAVPCNILPCSMRCSKILACGHSCPSVCGEVCPVEKYCQLCCNNDVRTQVVDYTQMDTYDSVSLDDDPCFVLPCGHVLTMTTLDGIMEFSKFYDADEQGRVTALKESDPFQTPVGYCPQCRCPIQNLQRYNRIWRRALLDESTKKFIAWSTASFVPLSNRLDKEETGLDPANVDGSQETPSADTGTQHDKICLSGPFDSVISSLTRIQPLSRRYRSILHLRKEIQKYLHKVTEAEQPFGRVLAMMESIRIQQGGGQLATADNTSNDNAVLQTKQRILASALSIRCDTTILIDFFGTRRSASTKFMTKYDWRALDVEVDFSDLYETCMSLIAEASSRVYPMVQVECVLYFVRLAALERANLSAANAVNNPTFEERLHQAQQLLATAGEACVKHPSATPGMQEELDAAEKMLREETFYEPVTNEEKRLIIQAMKTEFQVNGHW